MSDKSRDKSPAKKVEKSATIALRTRPAVKEAAEQAAADDDRSVSSLVERVLVKYLEQEGYLTGKDRR